MKRSAHFTLFKAFSFLLLLTVSVTTTHGQTQIEDYTTICLGAVPAETYPATEGPNNDGPSNAVANFPENNYGDVNRAPNPAWFYFKIDTPGSLQIAQTNSNDEDVDGVLWGPFVSTDDFIARFNQNGDPIFGAPRDSDYDGASGWNFNVASVAAGEYYVLLVSNYGGGQQIYL